VVLRTVSPLVRITIWDGPALKLCGHRCAHGVIACPLIGAVE
jgi:hypothetical protein